MVNANVVEQLVVLKGISKKTGSAYEFVTVNTQQIFKSAIGSLLGVKVLGNEGSTNDRETIDACIKAGVKVIDTMPKR